MCVDRLLYVRESSNAFNNTLAIKEKKKVLLFFKSYVYICTDKTQYSIYFHFFHIQMVERMEEKLEAANVDQKRLFLIVFQRFIMILSEHLVRSDTDGRDPDTDWYRWTIGRLQQVFLMVSQTTIILS